MFCKIKVYLWIWNILNLFLIFLKHILKIIYIFIVLFLIVLHICLIVFVKIILIKLVKTIKKYFLKTSYFLLWRTKKYKIVFWLSNIFLYFSFIYFREQKTVVKNNCQIRFRTNLVVILENISNICNTWKFSLFKY